MAHAWHVLKHDVNDICVIMNTFWNRISIIPVFSWINFTELGSGNGFQAFTAPVLI